MKAISIIAIIYGGLGVLFSICAIPIVFLQRLMIQTIPCTNPTEADMNIYNYIHTLHNLWFIYYPLMCLIGIVYIIAGMQLLKKKDRGIHLLKISAWSNIIWFITYTVSLYYFVIPIIIKGLKNFTVVLYILSALTGILMCAYPIFLLMFFFVKKDIIL